MTNKEIKITVPEGYEIDKENSTFERIKFKRIEKLTYDDVCRTLFTDKITYYIQATGNIGHLITRREDVYCSSNASSFYQLEQLLALNKLMNVAQYLNQGWTPNWRNRAEPRYAIGYNISIGELGYMTKSNLIEGQVWFKNAELCRQAIEILGEDTIKCALGVK